MTNIKGHSSMPKKKNQECTGITLLILMVLVMFCWWIYFDFQPMIIGTIKYLNSTATFEEGFTAGIFGIFIFDIIVVIWITTRDD